MTTATKRTGREDEVARFIRANRGALTDDLERELSRKFDRIAG